MLTITGCCSQEMVFFNFTVDSTGRNRANRRKKPGRYKTDREEVIHKREAGLKHEPECGNDVVAVDIRHFHIVDRGIVQPDIFPAEIHRHIRV